jgi:peptidoglycan hydrolase-like protein with peptidoglycan-binding domain
VTGRRAAVAGVATTVAVVAVVGTSAALAARDGDPAQGRPVAVPTARVLRGTLAETTAVDGRLGYAGDRSVRGQRAGTVTWVAAEGAVVHRGQVLYRVDLRPVPLLTGALPLFRRLSPGSRGADVRELEENLVALGHARGLGMRVDTRYTAATAAAVRRWQRALGVRRTGVVEAGDAVVARGPVRVTRAAVAPGERVVPGQRVVEGTGTARGVHVDLEVAALRYATVGSAVTVTLPTGTRLAGTVASVGAAAAAADGDPGGGSGGGSSGGGGSGGGSDGSGDGPEATVAVEVRLAGAAVRALGGLQAAPVSVELVARRVRGVLSVPVQALLARGGGRYAVTVVAEDGGRRDVPVTTGLFADGRVAVEGDLAAGDAVEVPAL